jgi:photosystem II stability/assembly factor-like uncharacterized protein/LmbE family N-acetylglucosaminyl deacetylase
MKKISLTVLVSAIAFVFFCLAFATNEKCDFSLQGNFFNKNYLSTRFFPGEELKQQQFKPDDILTLSIDGKMDENEWENAQVIRNFYISGRKPDKGIETRILSDKKNIYLFWKADNTEPLIANISKNDSALVGDDYVQVNLKPILPDSIKYGRDYFFSIAVNPNGAIWDTYYDPYHVGYFFTDWNSNAKVQTIKNNDNYVVEMAIPYSELDIYADPGWKWNLHFNRATGENKTISSSPTGVTVVQNIKVRNPRMLGYYWPRSEFWPDVIPTLEGIQKPVAEATMLNKPPRTNKKRDDVWSDCKEIVLQYDNKSTEILKEGTANACVAYDQNNLYLLLQSPHPYPTQTIDDDEEHKGGMQHQLAGLDGVYRDISLETKESFWILFQPGSANGDAVHQDFYFITVDYNGESTKLRFDAHGKPDREWNPELKTDIFKKPGNWGVEVAIPLDQLNIPYDCSDSWRMNIMYNVPLDEGNTIEGLSHIQAWYPTMKDEKNPEKTGKITSIQIECDKYVKHVFENQAEELSDKIESLTGLDNEKRNEFKKQLRAIRKKINSANFEETKNNLNLLDTKIGIVEEKNLYINSLELSNDGYPLNDICFNDAQNGIAVGAMGLILKTSDSGETWIKREKLTDSNFSKVFFVNDSEGWIAGGRIRSAESNETMSHDERGGDGIILHTTDGGETWQIQFAKRGTYLFDIFFTDNQNGWAVGEGGLLLHTTDGGKMWSQLPSTGTIKWLNGIHFFDKQNGFVVGESEMVLKTNNGGKSWQKVDAKADRKFYDFKSFYRDITFKGNKGWIVGQNGTILSTNDKGETWEPQATVFDEKVRELMDLRTVCFTDENNGFALGGLGTRMLKTTDGGESWNLIKVPNHGQIRGAWFGDNGTGYIVGGKSTILKTEDNAQTWKTVNGTDKKTDILIFSAHGDDSPIQHGSLMTYLSKIKNKNITVIHVTRDTHSNEYKGEYYDYEADRSYYLMGVKTVRHFDEFDTGNNGSRSFHINLRLWKGYDEMVRHMVAAIRTYQPDIIITHDPIFGEYNKPGHKIAGRAGFMAFYSSDDPDKFPELAGLGLKPHKAKKLYTYATEAFPATFTYEHLLNVPLEGHGETVEEWANRALRPFQSQGVHFVRHTPLNLVESNVNTPGKKEKSIFEGIK